MKDKTAHNILLSKKGSRVAAAVLFILAVLFLAASAVLWETPLMKQREMNSDTPQGVPCSLSVEAVLPSFAQDDELIYCACTGEDGYYYLLALTEAQFTEAFYDLCLYTLYPETHEAVAPVTIIGVTARINSELATAAAEYWCDGNVERLNADFGYVMLSTGAKPIYFSEPLLIAAVLFSAVAAVLYISFLLANRNAFASLKAEKGREQELASELQSEPKVVFKGGAALTNNYILNPSNGCAVRLSDIVWVYRLVEHTDAILKSQQLVVCTKAHAFELFSSELSSKCDAPVDKAFAELSRLGCMSGYTKEYLARYKELRKKPKQ